MQTALKTVAASLDRIDEISHARGSWKETHLDRLLSLHSNITRMIFFSEGLLQRPPRLHRVQETLDKLNAYIAKFTNLSAKLDSSYRKLGMYRAHSELVAAHRAAQAKPRDEYEARDAYRTRWKQEKTSRRAMEKPRINGSSARRR